MKMMEGRANMMNMLGWNMFFTMIFGTFLVIVVIYVLLSFIGKPSADKKADDALQILRERFARGEINEEEYNRMREVLKGK